MKSVEEARRDLLGVLPHFRLAMEQASIEPGSVGKFAIISEDSNGTGRVLGSFSSEEFLNDLALVLGETVEALEEGKLEAKAEQIIQTFGLRDKKV